MPMPARAVEQRPARVAGIDRRIGLDRAGNFSKGRSRQMPVQRAHDAACERTRQPERIADGDHRLPDLQVARAAERNRPQAFGQFLQLDDCQIVLGRDTDDIRSDGLAGIQLNQHLARPFHHVEIRDHVSRTVPDKTGTRTLRNLDVAEEAHGGALGRDVGNGWRCIFKELDQPSLIRHQCAAGRDWPGIGGLLATGLQWAERRGGNGENRGKSLQMKS
jgi:hypothetical protein